jgi:uroporphyrinogen-III decarboxylase
MIKIQASVSKGWLNKHGGFEFNDKYYLDPSYRMEGDKLCHQFIINRFPDYPIYNMEDNLVQAEHVVPGMILVGAIQPNIILAAALGAELIFATGKDCDVKGLPLKVIERPAELHDPEELLELPFIKELEKQFYSTKEKYPGNRVIPSFFWDVSGRATVHGIVTTSMKLVGEEILIKMMLEPELVHAIHKWIMDVYIHIVNHFSRMGEIKVTAIHVGECSGALLSEQLYREFIVPYVNMLGKEFEAVRLHSCGNSDAVLPSMCEVENLSVIDTGSNTSVAKIRQRMGKDFEINTVPPVEVMLSDKEQEIGAWLDKTLKENDGGNLKIGYHLEAEYNENNCNYIHEYLQRNGLAAAGRLY